jgi:acetate kinase
MKSIHSPSILVMNSGSSSIRFAVYQVSESLQKILHGKIDRIGLKNTTLQFDDVINQHRDTVEIAVTNHSAAASYLMDWLLKQNIFSSVIGVGHRIVHGMRHTESERVTDALLAELHRIKPCDPKHLPGEIALIEAFHQSYPMIPQVACFDTAFHQTMPEIAKLLPIPRRYNIQGIQRYGFHGLSYSYLMQQLQHLSSPDKATNKRTILAHLGNGASLAAVLDGCSIDTTMAFTPTAGIMMSTRSGDVDPGLFSYLARTENMTAVDFNHLVNKESGLLGVSETSSDMRDLLAKETSDVRAAEAIALFCYQVKKTIGAYAAVLGGLDTLVFSGGIGENAPRIRALICSGLDFLGIQFNAANNAINADIISEKNSAVTIRVIPTDEEQMIAKFISHILHIHSATGKY